VLGLSSPRDHGQNFEQADEAKRAFEVSEKTAMHQLRQHPAVADSMVVTR
jgi:hypothetical protein